MGGKRDVDGGGKGFGCIMSTSALSCLYAPVDY